jgi:hypothetical protein
LIFHPQRKHRQLTSKIERCKIQEVTLVRIKSNPVECERVGEIPSTARQDPKSANLVREPGWEPKLEVHGCVIRVLVYLDAMDSSHLLKTVHIYCVKFWTNNRALRNSINYIDWMRECPINDDRLGPAREINDFTEILLIDEKNCK